MAKESYVPQYRIKDLDETIENLSEACVHKTGNERIAGNKTFTSTFTLEAGSVQPMMKSTAYTKGTAPTSDIYMANKIYRENGNKSVFDEFYYIPKTTNRPTYILRMHNVSSASATEYKDIINAWYDGTNSQYSIQSTTAIAPTPPASDNSTKIATTNWIADATKSTALVHKAGDETITGSKTFSATQTFTGQVTSHNIVPQTNNTYNIGTADLAYSNVYGTYFSGTSYRAYWGDLAENYVADEIYPSGLLIQFGGNKEITKAVTKVNGVISSQPAFVLNNTEGGLPVALCGRVPVMIEGKINKFDKLCLSKTCGVARKKKWYEFWKHTIAIALESNDKTEIKNVLCVTKFNLD